MMISILLHTQRKKAEAPKEEIAAAEGNLKTRAQKQKRQKRPQMKNPSRTLAKSWWFTICRRDTHTSQNPCGPSQCGHERPEVDDIKVLNDLIRAGTYQSLEGAELITCNTTQASLSRLRNMIQQAENEVSYLEFKKAEATLRAAEQSLNCLKDFADAELAFQLYFFQGMVLFDNGDKDGAQQAFHNALTFMPTKRWDDYFAPDAKPLFDEIKAEIVKSTEQKLTIYPTLLATHLD